MKYTLAAILAICAAACKSPKQADSGKGQTAAAQTATQTPQAHIAVQTPQAVADSNNLFAFDLYSRLNTHDGANLFYSPFSISSALAMTYAGAKGQTAQEISHTLHFNPDRDSFNPGFRAMMEQIATDTADTSKTIKLDIANSLWLANGLHLLPQYAEVVKTQYHAEASQVSFANPSDIEESRSEINRWVENKTNDKIKDLIPAGALDASTRMVLVNAIYFNGRWATVFSKDSTRNDVFYNNSTASVKTAFMHNALKLNYYTDDVMQAIAMPYYGNKLDMVVFLPNEKNGMDKLEQQFTYSYYASVCASFRERKVVLSFPKFKTTQAFQLADVLKKMGMPVAFSGAADFSGIANEGLSISNVIHKAFIDVSEKGTEAAAATAITMVSMLMRPQPPVVFNANHPFIFVIRDKATGCILFMGKVENPLN